MPAPKSPNATPSPSAGDADFLSSTAFVADQIGETDDMQGDPAPVDAAPLSPFPPEMVEEGLKGFFNVVFGMVASNRGAHWTLQPFEEKGLAKAWCPLMQMLLSNLGSTEQGMIAMAVLTTGAVVGGKVALDAQVKAESIKQASKMASTRTPEFAG